MFYDKVKFWVDQYGHSEVSDKRAIQDFVECETTQAHGPLRSQLHAISQGNYDYESLQKMLGKNREVRYGTYEAWAKLMLGWMATKG